MNYREALEAIARQNNGILRPSDVVEAARPKDSILHNAFEWNDSVAAQKYRIEQAKELIRVQFVTKTADEQPIRAFVSLSTDRGTAEGGYRITTDVMSDEELYEIMKSDARKEMIAFQQKYKRIKELASVFVEMDNFFKAM